MTDPTTAATVAIDALTARIHAAGGLGDGTDPRALAASYVLALKGHGWRPRLEPLPTAASGRQASPEAAAAHAAAIRRNLAGADHAQP